jgi:hypothetical protein
MATVMNVKASKAFCDEVYTELAGMKRKLMDLQNKTRTIGPESDVAETFRRHLSEMADEIDWKLQILAHSCSYEWKGSEDYEHSVEVSEVDRSLDSNEFSGGYLGG